MHNSGISIWFFIGISLVVNGALITGAAIWQLINPPELAQRVQLYGYHAGLWWGGLMFLLGLVYTVKFRPCKKCEANS
jgi:hypothetical protein